MFRHLPKAVRFLNLGILISVGGPAFAQSGGANADLAGKRLFLRCASCHTLSANAPSRIGPTLQAVVGRKAGSVAGAKYSAAMKSTNFTWTESALDKWLTKPNSVVPGTSMAFAGIPDSKDRQTLIAYLKKSGN